MRRSASRLVLALVLGAAACGGPSSEPGEKPAGQEPGKPAGADAAAVSAAAQQEAATLFSTRCAPCHGPQGQGDGPASAGLTPKPRDLSDPAWQESVDDEYVEKILLYGGIAVGKSAAMPPNPDLKGKPEVLEALRLHVRALEGQ